MFIAAAFGHLFLFPEILHDLFDNPCPCLKGGRKTLPGKNVMEELFILSFEFDFLMFYNFI